MIPMNDEVTLHIPDVDENGEEITDRYGRPRTRTITSRARVKYSGKLIVDRNGNEANAVLELRLPAEQEINPGTLVEWVDPFGKTISSPVATIQDVNDYPGAVIYRKVFTT